MSMNEEMRRLMEATNVKNNKTSKKKKKITENKKSRSNDFSTFKSLNESCGCKSYDCITCFPASKINEDLGVSFRTAGDGLWSDHATSVKIEKIKFIQDDEDFGELLVHFDTNTWDVNKHGLIYTDKMFKQDLDRFLVKHGFDQEAVEEGVFYSEQGMQGSNYVSFDVQGKEVIEQIKQSDVIEVINSNFTDDNDVEEKLDEGVLGMSNIGRSSTSETFVGRAGDVGNTLSNTGMGGYSGMVSASKDYDSRSENNFEKLDDWTKPYIDIIENATNTRIEYGRGGMGSDDGHMIDFDTAESLQMAFIDAGYVDMEAPQDGERMFFSDDGKHGVEMRDHNRGEYFTLHWFDETFGGGFNEDEDEYDLEKDPALKSAYDDYVGNGPQTMYVAVDSEGKPYDFSDDEEYLRRAYGDDPSYEVKRANVTVELLEKEIRKNKKDKLMDERDSMRNLMDTINEAQEGKTEKEKLDETVLGMSNIGSTFVSATSESKFTEDEHDDDVEMLDREDDEESDVEIEPTDDYEVNDPDAEVDVPDAPGVKDLDFDTEDTSELIAAIDQMQQMGMSLSDRHYDITRLEDMPRSAVERIHNAVVIGDADEDEEDFE